MQQDLENLVLDVQAKLSIGRSALASAQTVWRDTKNALLSGYDKGEKPSTVVALGDEFLSARRFCDDARELLAFHNLKHASDPASRPSPTVSSTEEVEFFAIDAHLLRAFAQHGSTVDLRRLHRGFSHFPSERQGLRAIHHSRVRSLRPAFHYQKPMLKCTESASAVCFKT